MKITLPNFKKINILVIGDIILDCYYFGKTDRISPEAPVPIVQIKKKEKKLGGAANVAANISQLGANVKLIGFIGNDKNSKILIKKLKKIKITTDLIKISNYSTNVKKRIYSNQQQLLRIDFEKNIQKKDKKLVLNNLKKKIKKFNLLILSDYGKGCLSKVKEIINIAKLTKIPIFIDPKGNNFNQYFGATLLTPNIFEFEKIVGKCKNNKEIEKKGINLIKKLNLQSLLITRSEKGMTLLEKKKKPIHIPTKAKKICDVTGAGDTVISVLSCSYAANLNLFQSSFLANIAAGIVIKKIGTSTISYMELKKNILKNKNIKFGIISEKKLLKAVKIFQTLGEKIVITTGFFNTLNSKNIEHLSKAKKLGDKLIVAINSDKSIKLLKKNYTQINPLKKRMKILSSLSSVDWVISFDDNNPKKLIKKISPNIIF